jgi:hypothetical protein
MKDHGYSSAIEPCNMHKSMKLDSIGKTTNQFMIHIMEKFYTKEI